MKSRAFKITWIVPILLLIVLPAFGQTPQGAALPTVQPAQTPAIDITILATTDIHNNFMDYDYFTDMATEQTGLNRIATMIAGQREKNPNILLFDNGDIIQGNPLGEYLAKNPPAIGETGPMMAFLNAMRYDAMTLGNHEFNFGLPYLNQAIGGARFPVLSANVVNPLTRTPYFRPYSILHRSFRDKNGSLRIVRVGVLGLTPPQIVTWDGAHLLGRVETLDGYETAAKYVPEMKAAGADIIIILAHTGIQDFPRKGGEENFAHFLTTIPDVDAIITGHSHELFPGRSFERIAGADLEKGTINGIPLVMPGRFADTLGVINLTLNRIDGRWRRVDGSGSLAPVYDAAARKSDYPPNKELTDLFTPIHEAVLSYIRSPIGADEGGETSGGRLTAPLNSFFALVRDDYSVQLINEAQIWYAQTALADTEWSKLPILSAAAPFKAGGRQGPRYYTNVPAGPLAIKNIADIYVFPNTVVILKLTGQDIKEWLERSAGQYNRINPSLQDEQGLIADDFPTYLFDVIDGVSYRIDPTQPRRYNADGSVNDSTAERIKDLRFQNWPIRGDQEFVLVTNNYRAYGGGNFPGGNPGNIIMETPDESRQVILKYIESRGELNPRTDGNWTLTLPSGAGPLVFPSSPLATEILPRGIEYVRTDEAGFGIYKVAP